MSSLHIKSICPKQQNIGTVLWATVDSNGNRHPISFISKTFSPTEHNYEIYDRELLAIIHALTEWRHYIQGSSHMTTVLSDHKNLTYYHEAQKLNWQQARWSLYLSEYDIKLVHTPGHKMIQSDTDEQSGALHMFTSCLANFALPTSPWSSLGAQSSCSWIPCLSTVPPLILPSLQLLHSV